MPFLQRMWGGCGPVGQWLTGNGAPVVWLFGLFCITMAARLQHNGAPIAAQRGLRCWQLRVGLLVSGCNTVNYGNAQNSKILTRRAAC